MNSYILLCLCTSVQERYKEGLYKILSLLVLNDMTLRNGVILFLYEMRIGLWYEIQPDFVRKHVVNCLPKVK